MRKLLHNPWNSATIPRALLCSYVENKIGAFLNSHGATVRKYEDEFDISKTEFWIVFLHGDPQRKTDRDVENSDRVEWLRNRNLTRWQIQKCPEDMQFPNSVWQIQNCPEGMQFPIRVST